MNTSKIRFYTHVQQTGNMLSFRTNETNDKL